MDTLLQINTNVGWNSTGRITEAIGRAARHAGIESYIAYGRSPGGSVESESRLVKVGGPAGMALHGLRTRLTDSHGLGSRRATVRLLREIDRMAPDVVHLHNIHGYYLNYKELFGYLAATDVPVVWTLHDCWPLTGHCAFFDTAGCGRWRRGCHDCPQLRAYPASIFADRSSRNYESKRVAFNLPSRMRLVAVSEWVRDIVAQSYLAGYPVEVVYNGLDVPSYPWGGERSERPMVLAVASVWDGRKGLDDLLRLRSLLPRETGMTVVGLNGRQRRSLPEGIQGVERISDRSILNEYYRRATVLVNPSMGETLSLVNLEAQACGTPVVAYRSGGMPETVAPDTGIVVAPGDVEAMARAVHAITLSEGRYGAEACRRNIETRFNAAVTYGRYIDIYRDMSK